MSFLTTAFHHEPLEYDGRQLRSHFVLDTSGLYGDAALAFVGPCRVELSEMVDLEDVRAREAIASPRMVHVLVEHFDLRLREGVLRQRILGRLAGDLLMEAGVEELRCRGDDLWVKGRKASVSIATRSRVSTLIHFGLNVDTEGTPIPTWGLSELPEGVALRDPEKFALELLRRYEAEIDDIHRAVGKVRGVP